METITKKDLLELIASMLMAHEGEPMTEYRAAERAKNITAALSGLTVEE